MNTNENLTAAPTPPQDPKFLKGLGLGILSGVIIISLVELLIGLLHNLNAIRGDFPTETYLLWGAIILVGLIASIRVVINKSKTPFWLSYMLLLVLISWFWLALRTSPM